MKRKELVEDRQYHERIILSCLLIMMPVIFDFSLSFFFFFWGGGGLVSGFFVIPSLTV